MGSSRSKTRFFDRRAAHWDEDAHAAEKEARLGRIVRGLRLKAGAAVLDVGCGTGALVPFLLRAVGGRGSVIGTVLGVTLLGLISPALTFLGASPYWEQALQGGIILAAVMVDASGVRRAANRHARGTEAHRAGA